MADSTADCDNPSRDDHVLRKLKRGKYGTAEENQVDACFDQLEREFSQEHCQRPSGFSHRETSCDRMSCLGEYEEDDDGAVAIQHAVAVFLLKV